MRRRPAAGVVQAYIETLNWRRIEGGLALFHEGTRWEVPPFKGTFNGPAGYLKYWGIWSGASPDFWLEITRLKLSDQWGVCHYLLRGRHTGLLRTPMGVIGPTKKEFSLPVTEVYEVSAGRFAGLHTSFCLATLMSQLGEMPADPQAPLSLHLNN